MNQKYNPLLSLVALLLFAIILLLTFTGCTTEAAAAETKTADRFTVKHVNDGCTVITDNETGVQYLAYILQTVHGKGVGLFESC